MSKRIRKVIALTILVSLVLQASPLVYANETEVVQNSAICAIKEVTKEDSTEEKEVDLQTEQINKAFIEAKETLKKQVTIKVDKVDEEKLKAYLVPGPLVPYVRSAVLTPIDEKTIQADIDYTTWYQAVKAYKEPKLYENQISDTAKNTLAEAQRVIKELKLEEETSAFVKEKAIHDYLISTGKYSETIDGNIGAAMHGAEGLILNKDGMCRSYAEGMQLFMELLGVESKIIMGWSRRSYDKHVWNMIKLDDGNWYYVDLTWDDPKPEEPGVVHYDYFNVTFRIINGDHELEEWQDPEPANELTYFPYADIIGYSNDGVIDIIKEQLLSGKKEGEVFTSFHSDVNEVMELTKRAIEKSGLYGKSPIKLWVDKKSTKLYSFAIYE